MNAKAEGFYGMFNDFGASVFTVYLAASEEGWVYVLYDCMDSLPSHFAFIYFLTLIFFLAWLVKVLFFLRKNKRDRMCSSPSSRRLSPRSVCNSVRCGRRRK